MRLSCEVESERTTLERPALSTVAILKQPQDVGEERLRNGDLGHLKADMAALLTTFAPILMSFSFRLVSDQSLIGSGVVSVRKKLPRL